MDIGTLSLDEIIKKEGTRGGKFGGRKRRDGGVQKPKRNPKKWDNDKFFEAQGGSRRSGGVGARSSSAKAIARLSNIPFNVSQEELDDLFAEFRLSRIALHYDFRGRSLGTAELHGPANEIARVAREFKGVEIDGRPLGIQVVGVGSSARSLSDGPRIRHVGGGRNDRVGRRSGGGKSGGAKLGGDSRKKLTAEELDKELDEYMKTSKD